MDALVHDRTYTINESKIDTIDRIMIGDKTYSSKPPVYSTIGAGVYWTLRELTPLSLRKDAATRDRTIYVLSVLLGGLPHLVLLAYAHRLLRWLVASPTARLWTFACLATGQLGVAYATSVNNHVPAAAALLIMFYYAYGLRRGHLERHRFRHWAWAGLAGGFAPTFDLGALFLSTGIGVYLLVFDWRRTLGVLAPAALAPIAVHFGLTWHIMGSPIPAYLQSDLYDYPGSYWRAPKGIDALKEPRSTYLFNILFGHHGIFSMTPVLLLSVFEVARSALGRGRTHRPEALAIGVPWVVLIVFYTLTTTNYGGACAGFRWLLIAVPITLLFSAVWIAEHRGTIARTVFLVFLLIGQFHTFAALRDPWVPSTWQRWLRQWQASSDIGPHEHERYARTEPAVGTQVHGRGLPLSSDLRSALRGPDRIRSRPELPPA